MSIKHLINMSVKLSKYGAEAKNDNTILYISHDLYFFLHMYLGGKEVLRPHLLRSASSFCCTFPFQLASYFASVAPPRWRCNTLLFAVCTNQQYTFCHCVIFPFHDSIYSKNKTKQKHFGKVLSSVLELLKKESKKRLNQKTKYGLGIFPV